MSKKWFADQDLYTKRLPSPYANYVGVRQGRLIGLHAAGHDSGRHLMIVVRCDCGVEKIIRYDNFNKGTTKSCGCLYNERQSDDGRLQNQVDKAWLRFRGNPMKRVK